MLKPLPIALILVHCFAFTVFSETKPDFSEARAVLVAAIEKGAFPGCTVCVGTDKKILWSDALGTMDYDQKTPVTRKTIYDLASLTKVTGTTSVFMQLVGAGKVDVKDSVEKYLPEFIEAAGDEAERARRRQITVEHLLTHTSGLTGWAPFYKTVNSYPEMLRAIWRTPLDNPPGKKFRYSDPNMILLGEIAARAGGKPLPELEQELVFRPLKMKDTMRNPSTKLWSRIPPTEKWPDKEGFVHGVVHDENARAAGGITGHAGLFSTAEDLSRLATELLRASQGSSSVLRQSVVRDFFQEREFIPNLGRSLGWGVSSTKHADGRTTPTYVHTGFTGTSIRIDPERKLYIILLSNRVHPTRDNEKIGSVRRDLTEAVQRTVDSVVISR